MTRIGRVLWKAVIKLTYDGGLAVASNIALSLLLSLFPFLMLIASLVRLYGEPALADEVVDLVLGHWPGDSAKPIAEQVRILLSQSPGEFFSISTGIALVLATNGIESARDGLNRAYRTVETRSFFWRRLQGAVFVVIGAVGLIATTFILVGTPLVWNFLVARLDWIAPLSFTVTVVQYLLSFTILALILYAFHRFLPNTNSEKQMILWGILLTIAAIIVGSLLFGLYLQNIANYTVLYAGLAGMMTAIIYLYCLSVMILFGAEFNTALMEERNHKRVKLKKSDMPNE